MDDSRFSVIMISARSTSLVDRSETWPMDLARLCLRGINCGEWGALLGERGSPNFTRETGRSFLVESCGTSSNGGCPIFSSSSGFDLRFTSRGDKSPLFCLWPPSFGVSLGDPPSPKPYLVSFETPFRSLPRTSKLLVRVLVAMKSPPRPESGLN